MDPTLAAILTVVGPIVFGVIAGRMSTARGRTYGSGFGWGFLLGPIGIIIVAVRGNAPGFTPGQRSSTFGTGRRVITASTSTRADAGHLLVVDDLRTRFLTERGVVRAVDGVSFSLERGKTLGVVGESGSGKTVLSRSIMGLLPGSNVDITGQVLYEGRDITGARPDVMRGIWGTEMSMIFQDPMTSLNPVMKIGTQIGESLRHHLDMPKDEARKTSLALLKSVGIPEAERRLNQYPHELSGGMRQRVTIAIALACGPKLLFADEPTTALDVTVQAQILNLLAQQQRERHMAMILVTHDLGVVAGRTDEIAVMYAGQIVERAPTKTLFANMKMPYTEALLKSIPKLEQPSHSRLAAIPGRPPDLVAPPKGCKFSPRCPYVRERCIEEEPPLIEADIPGHVYKCWYPVGTVEPTRPTDETGTPVTVGEPGEVAVEVAG